MTAREEAPHPRRMRAKAAIGAVGLALVVAVPGTAIAVPPPPPNPSDSEIEESRDEQRERAGEVGRLTNRLARADARLTELQSQVARKLELANKARVDAENAQARATQAQRQARSASKASKAAAKSVGDARAKMDDVLVGSYQQGTGISSLGAYAGAADAKAVLDRAQVLEALRSNEQRTLERLRTARVEKSNADAAARKALQVARQREREAKEAERAAESAYGTAVDARKEQASRTQEIEAERSQVQRLLYAAQQKVHGLEGQRERYEDWLAAKRREEALKARQAALAKAAQSQGGGSRPSVAPGASVETVVARALSQIGVQYAWGGGNQSGPTYGVRDGGVADSYGDYRKIGFDCSGLMIYAFAGVKALPHYSGYQYNSGRKVPLSQMRRGDMLFWGTAGIHHVALYLGNGQMVEAPQSGLRVRVAPVRYNDILPYATRLIG